MAHRDITRFYRGLILALGLCGLFGCASQNPAVAACDAEGACATAVGSDSILIYGRPSCGNCQALRASLKSARIAYTDYDVDVDEARNREMWDKIATVKKGANTITLPVVDVNGTILINHPTSLAELKPYLKAKR